jgi:hypothetical protein
MIAKIWRLRRVEITKDVEVDFKPIASGPVGYLISCPSNFFLVSISSMAVSSNCYRKYDYIIVQYCKLRVWLADTKFWGPVSHFATTFVTQPFLST